jgi:hypothetical protein
MFNIGDIVVNTSTLKEGIIINNDKIFFSNKIRKEKKLIPIYCIKYNDNSINFELGKFLKNK